MSLTPQDFVSKWKRADARERQLVQEHFIEEILEKLLSLNLEQGK